MPLPATIAGAPVAVALAMSAGLIGALGLKRSVRIAWWFADRLPAPRASRLDPREIGWAQSRMIARVADALPVTPRCLSRSLLLAASLRRRGIAAELCLGTRIGGAFDAHAWVEIDGEPVNEAPDVLAGMTPLLRISTLRA